MEKHPLVRTIYLYLFTIVGLALLTIGAVGFLNMGLKAFIFTQADEEQRLWNTQPPMPAGYPEAKIKNIQSDPAFSDDEKAIAKQWLADYKNWQETRKKIDPVTAQRHRDASFNLAMIVVGAPLYLYHWGVIKRETRRKENKDDKA